MQLNILPPDFAPVFVHDSIATAFIKTVDGYAPPTTRTARGIPTPNKLLQTDFIILGDGFTSYDRERLQAISTILPNAKIFNYTYPLDKLPVGNGISLGGYITGAPGIVFSQNDSLDYIDSFLRALRLSVTESHAFGV